MSFLYILDTSPCQLPVLPAIFPSLWLAFIFINCTFQRAKVLNFDNVQLLNFLYFSFCFLSLFIAKSWRCSPMFSYKLL